MLTQTLRGLERDGLVSRTLYPQVPPRVEYELTETGHTLHAPLKALEDWASTHMVRVITARESYDSAHRSGRRPEKSRISQPVALAPLPSR